MIRCLIVDDEPFAREELADILKAATDIEVIGQCNNAVEALQAIHRDKPDLVFLDIQMPRITGMEMIAMLDPDNMTRVVFVTAYDEYAINAFENHAFDYLLKPVDEQRLAKTLDKLRKDLRPRDLQVLMPSSLEVLPCYSGNRLKVVPVKDVEYVFSDLGGIHVATATSQVHTQMTLKLLEEKTPLVRCHRQYLLMPSAISEIILQDTGALTITHSGAKVPVSRRYLKSLKQRFGYQ
ncbi:MAG: two-component system response regulator BtsR [Shewanella sp.]|nr:two-component system response regulator BtsR [Shewanella sp.]MCF1429685.1 two-component system response regulator BtsR [Shewanella sp.]MCF1437302.1 two-component system response regulator BtsR [Shewanella sp.]MCF1457839.1 two-component system response regulator BtsR [Shewanella sp.]